MKDPTQWMVVAGFFLIAAFFLTSPWWAGTC